MSPARRESRRKKHGANLVMLKKDGQAIKGELIAVKQNSLLLLDKESGADVSVAINDIKVIKIMKVSKVWEGARIGGFIGAAAGALLFLASKDAEVTLAPFAVLSSQPILGGVIGVIVGGGIVAAAGTDKTIQIEEMSNFEINAVLEELRKKARIRDYK